MKKAIYYNYWISDVTRKNISPTPGSNPQPPNFCILVRPLACFKVYLTIYRLYWKFLVTLVSKSIYKTNIISQQNNLSQWTFGDEQVVNTGVQWPIAQGFEPSYHNFWRKPAVLINLQNLPVIVIFQHFHLCGKFCSSKGYGDRFLL